MATEAERLYFRKLAIVSFLEKKFSADAKYRPIHLSFDELVALLEECPMQNLRKYEIL